MNRILFSLLGIALLAAITRAQAPAPCTAIDNCDACENTELECISCPGKALLVDGSGCNDCPLNCIECNDEGTKDSPDIVCTKCSGGFVLNAMKECLACSTGCQYCNITADSTICQTCYEPNAMQKYFARNDNDGTCLECPTNCKKCTVKITDDVPSAVCSTCKSGNALNADKTCSPCPDNCVTCSINGDGDAICSACSTDGVQKYVLDKADGSNKCLECNCGDLSLCNGEQQTSSTSKCSGCLDGKYLTTAGACLACTGGCATCETSASNCLSCKSGYVITGGSTCSDCVSNCDECKDTTTCDKCDESFGVTESDLICEVCVDPYCNDCPTSATICAGCENGFYFNAGAATKCTPCADSNCKTCDTAADMCEACNGDWKVWNGACVDRTCADPQCTSCPTDPTVCTKCKERFRVDGDDNCEDCPADCLKCDTASGKCDAGGCIPGKGLLADAAATCQSCPTDCNICDLATTGKCDAGGCIPGKGLIGDAAATCQSCPTDCNVCDLALTGKCDAGGCIDGKGLIGNAAATCQSCTDTAYCLNCDLTDAGTCDKCKTGYYIDGSDDCISCSSVLDGCAECTQAIPPTECTKCSDGLVMNNAENGCYVCTLTGCVSCSATNMCEECSAGYKLRNSDKTCVLCDTNCETSPDSCSVDVSSGSATCSLCKTGFILNTGTGDCDACDQNCATTAGACSYTTPDGVKCTTCADGYQANDGFTCDACPSGCKTCPPNTDGDLTCSMCLGTRYANSDVCGRCPNNCLECTETKGVMICSTCADKHALDSTGNQCKACPSNCEKCTFSGGNVICQACEDHFGLSGNKQSCVACSTLTFANCDTCTNANSNDVATCLSCQAGYTFKDDGSECTACSSLTDCSVCQDKPFECSSCKSGYSETDDHMCAYLCYVCSGDAQSCGTYDAATVGNVTEPCFEGACFAFYDTRTNANPAHMRGCFNQTCSGNSNEQCNDDGVCSRCCTGDKCNNWTLAGMDSGVDTLKQTTVCILVTFIAFGLLR